MKIPRNVNGGDLVWAGWKLIEELDAGTGETGSTLLKSYLWGTDFSNASGMAGGAGGLLAVRQGGVTYYPVYDNLGNVTGYLNGSTGATAARYEYTAFGYIRAQNGSYASFSFGYASQYTDRESGLVYYGMRYYHPTHGRFINRDPIGEAGGLNLYGFVGNDPANRWDQLGTFFGVDDAIAVVQTVTKVYGFVKSLFGLFGGGHRPPPPTPPAPKHILQQVRSMTAAGEFVGERLVPAANSYAGGIPMVMSDPIAMQRTVESIGDVIGSTVYGVGQVLLGLPNVDPTNRAQDIGLRIGHSIGTGIAVVETAAGLAVLTVDGVAGSVATVATGGAAAPAVAVVGVAAAGVTTHGAVATMRGIELLKVDMARGSPQTQSGIRGRAPEFPSGQLTESGVLRQAEKYLGPGYKEIPPGSGRFVSADGMRQVRFGASEVRQYPYHVHFEAYNTPYQQGGRVVENAIVTVVPDPSP